MDRKARNATQQKKENENYKYIIGDQAKKAFDDGNTDRGKITTVGCGYGKGERTYRIHCEDKDRMVMTEEEIEKICESQDVCFVS